jgi:hypothetical protein
MKRLAHVVVAALALSLVAGCDTFGGSSGSDAPAQAGGGPGPGGGSGGGSNGGSGGCREAGPLTRDFLAQFPARGTRTITNPCLEFPELVEQVTGLVPSSDRSKAAQLVTGLRDIAGRIGTIGDVAACGYETDRLALEIYQDRKFQWSIGVVAVIRGDVGALVDTAKCFLRKQLPFDPRPQVIAPEEPQPDFCLEGRVRDRGGERYTVLWLGSSDFMCGDLEGQLRSGRERDGGYSATVKASPDVAVRAKPGTQEKELRRAAGGEVMVVRCYLTGELVTGRRGESSKWFHVPLDGGYVSGAWLDTGDAADKPGECAPDS